VFRERAVDYSAQICSCPGEAEEPGRRDNSLFTRHVPTFGNHPGGGRTYLYRR
jgi:hypothetical protein